MPSIQISLPNDRGQAGSLTLVSDTGTVLAGPYPALGRSANNLATRHGNPSRNPLQPFGDTPLGNWSVQGVVETGTGTRYNPRSYGPNGAIVLTPSGGQALEAANNGRTGIMIHGGAPGRTGGLRPTAGCIRLSNSDMQNFLMIASLATSTQGIISGADGRVGLPVTTANVDIEDVEDVSDPPPNDNTTPIGNNGNSGNDNLNQRLMEEIQRLNERHNNGDNDNLRNELRRRLEQNIREREEARRLQELINQREGQGQQRREQERANRDRQEQQRREQERANRDRQEQQRREQERANRDRQEQQRREQEQQERAERQADAAAERAERRQRERENRERENREREQRERENRERENREREQRERENRERENREREQRERENREREQRERDNREQDQITLARHFGNQFPNQENLGWEQLRNLGYPRDRGLTLPDLRNLFDDDFIRKYKSMDSPSLNEIINLKNEFYKK